MSASSASETSRTNSQGRAAEIGKAARLAGKLAALTGAAGAMLSGEASAEPVSITYTPTAGVAAAQGIPGFSFTSPTTVTPGELRPAALAVANWDVDGDGNGDFSVANTPFVGGTIAVIAGATSPFTANPNGLLGGGPYSLNNLLDRAAVGPASPWFQTAIMTGNGVVNAQSAQSTAPFVTNVAGYFGFRFAFDNTPTNYYYGWGSLTIDLASPGTGYKITEAFYQTTPNTAIQVGDVPGATPVPELSGEPSGIALLAAGFFGLEALRARRRRPALAC
jgi:hypothetical protein